MNTAEKKGCRSILDKLSYDEVFSLKDTVTKKQLSTDSRREAIEIIISYSESAEELLKRKKIKRELLFQYLADKSIVVSPAADKAQLTARCLELWDSGDCKKYQQLQDEHCRVKPLTATTKPAATRGNNSHYRVPAFSSSGLMNRNESCNFNRSQDQQFDRIQGAAGTSKVQQFNEIHETHVNIIHQTNIHVVQDTDIKVNQVSGSDIQRTQHGEVNNTEQSIGEAFASWFYKTLNSNNPTLGQTSENFGPQHFWDDVVMYLLCSTPELRSDKYAGSAQVAERFLALVKEELILFNPNIGSSGVRVETTVHGLMAVFVCGTLHRNSDLLGVFQQMFGLVRDPRFENNWKIKATKLGLQNTQVMRVPCLHDFNQSQILSLDM